MDHYREREREKVNLVVKQLVYRRERTARSAQEASSEVKTFG